MRSLKLLFGIGILTLLFAACAPVAQPFAAPAPSRQLVPSGEAGKAVGAPANAQAPAVAPGQPSAPVAQADRANGEGDAKPSGAAQPFDRMIIRTANMTMTVKDVGDSIDAITDLTRRAGGYIAGTNFRYEGERRVASLSLRIPSQGYDDTMRELRRLAIKVEDETSSGQDVTEEYSDLGSQLRNYEATEAQYLDLLKKAQSIDEILKVQQRLTDVRAQIERLKGRMQHLERRSDLAQINISLLPEGAAKAEPTSGWQLERIVNRAWEASLRVLRGVAEVVVTVLVFSWWLIPVVAVAYVVATALRRRQSAPHA